MEHILVTGAAGQVGSELTPALRQRYGSDHVVAAIHESRPGDDLADSGPLVHLEVRDAASLEEVVRDYRVDTIYHLAALLSATAAGRPQLAWDVNVSGLLNVLEVARKFECALFFPSSIGAFGPSTPKNNTPQVTVQRPNKMYGITKVAGELLCDFYYERYGLDTRGLRYPGLISYKTLPQGGTTDYAVEIFYSALEKKRYWCPLKSGTYLDMMYMPDAIRAAIELMEADPAKLVHRNAYNITAMSFDPEEIYQEIKKVVPEFEMGYKIDPLRQGIAETWPNRLDDEAAREEWGWRPEYDLPTMTRDMLENLSKQRQTK